MGLFLHIKNFAARIIGRIEDSNAPFAYFIMTFLFATTLRNFLEFFSDTDSDLLLSYYFHYDVSYIFLALLIIIFIYFMTKTEVVKIAKLVLTSFVILNLAMIFDLIISKGKGFNISYMLPGVHDNIIQRFFTFFGSFTEMGISPGIRIEVAMVLIGILLYFFIKFSSHEKSKESRHPTFNPMLKSILCTFITYFIIFVYLAMPILINFIFRAVGLRFDYSDGLLTNIYLAGIFVLGLALAFIKDRKLILAIIMDARPLRSLAYLILIAFGVLLGLKYGNGSFQLTAEVILNFLLIAISAILAWVYSVMTNNLTDYDIDAVCNKQRPTVAGKIEIKKYNAVSWLVLVLALVYPASIGFEAFFLILLFIGLYFMYSMPPLRLKRVPLLSKLIIAMNALVLAMLGFFLVNDTLRGFPSHIIGIFLVGFTLALNFIDLKDYDGDKKAGIKTLPVILGLKQAKLLIGVFFIILAFIPLVLLKSLRLTTPFIALHLIMFYFINRKKYSELPVFVICLLDLLLLCIIVIARL
jgi:4-hydroxybenzoate polyprenyltransferase